MTMVDVHGDVAGQVANQIVNHHCCPGQEMCPFDRDEAERQRRFEKHTGIACSSGARQALEYLLNCGAFNYKQLAIAWRAGSLHWDIESLTLKIKVSRVELWYGRFMMLFGLAAFGFGSIGMIVAQQASFRNESFLSSAFMTVLIGVIPFASRQLVQPNQIARRAVPFLARYYAPPS